jgi:hypothetical protein
LEEDPNEIKDLAQNQNFSKQQKRMEQLMIAWRTNLKDPYPLQSEKRLPFKPSYNNDARTLDRWQPKWIREKYFDGRNDPDHGKK